ncbi:peptidyl-prolyl cis-trans isomerase [Croceitalea rosinachiae]|uniref:Peptidyl-prolyl cis-trans isomerase n=1 Tax=Croceitalea rosinachiae TaxID=3075596 RepID=A0ABU3ADN5_9FLAO|nr:peptidyl-prolyl cis-trans isomerase [Croceitalea sp. F388]MDT0608304.1 peptidyl-prolyl cis-trans isomerase [Croceitalea sp. F388]
MLFLKHHSNKYFLIIGVLFLISCGSFLKDDTEVEPIARVGESYLYAKDLQSFITPDMSQQDSTAFAINYINKWASKQLLLSKSKINLSEEKLEEFNRLVNDYKADLYTRAYIEALVQQSNDTAVSKSQLESFYESQKENFKLNEKLVQLRFVVLPNQFLDKQDVVDKIKSFKGEDKAYLDSIAVQFKKIHFNDSVWVSTSRVLAQIGPLNYSNQDKHLKKSQFFELEDSLGVYLGKVTNVLDINDIAPLAYIEPDIKRVLLNRRRLEYVRKLETEIIDEGIKKNEFEIYEK